MEHEYRSTQMNIRYSNSSNILWTEIIQRPAISIEYIDTVT